MPVVGSHESKNKPQAVDRIALAVILTFERTGLLSATLESLKKASQDLHVIIYDDGSQSEGKLMELRELEDKGYHVNYEPHRGLVRTWMKIFDDLAISLDTVGFAENDGVVLLEDDLLFSKGWDETLLKMAKGVADKGLNPGAMTCLRCHEVPQAQIMNLNGVRAYQSMQHGFQVNMVPIEIFRKMWVFEEAAVNSENGEHGIDIWFIGGLSHRLGLTSFMSEESWVAHTGSGRSIAEGQGYATFKGVGYNLVHGLLGETLDQADGAQLF